MSVLWVLCIAAAVPVTQEIHTERFVIRHTDRATAAAHLLAQHIEGHRDRIQARLGRDWPGTTEVRLGFDRAEFEALALGPVPSWSVALTWPQQNIMLLEAKSLAQADGQQTLRHELVHIALGRLGEHWPRWFHEGFAQHLTQERKFSLEHYSTLARAVSADRIFRFSDLADDFPQRPADVEIAYAQSSAFVDFLFERHPARSFSELIDGLLRDEPFEIAFSKGFHTSLNLEERLFRDELPGRYPFWPLVATGTSLWAFAALLVVVGYYRRRRVVMRLRADQEAMEAAEDAAARIVAAEQAQALAAELPPSTEVDEPGKPTLH